MSEYRVGDEVMMTEPALENYGEEYNGDTFVILHVEPPSEHEPEFMYDIEDHGFSGAVYSYEIKRF